jgi:hypothetical protein
MNGSELALILKIRAFGCLSSLANGNKMNNRWKLISFDDLLPEIIGFIYLFFKKKSALSVDLCDYVRESTKQSTSIPSISEADQFMGAKIDFSGSMLSNYR